MNQPQPQYEQEYVEGNQPVQDSEVYASLYQEERIRNVIAQLNPDHVLIEIHWRIRGYIKNQFTGEWQKLQKDMPEPSPELVANFISYLSSILTQNTTMSNYAPEEINAIMKLVIHWLSDDLRANQLRYGLQGKYTEWTRVAHMLLNQVFSTFKRAINGNESKRMFNALSMIDNLQANQQKKPSLMDNIKGVFVNSN